MEDDGRRPLHARRRTRSYHLVQVLLVVGQAGKDRRDEDAGADARVGEAPEDLEPLAPRGRSGLDHAPHCLVEHAYAHRDAEACNLVQTPVDVEVTQDERGLREHRERVLKVRQRLEDAARQPVPALAVLIRIGCGPHRDRLALPARRCQVAPESFDDVDLHDDLGREVLADPEVEVGVVCACEAVVAAVRAAPIRVHGPPKGNAARLVHAVQRVLALLLEVLRPRHCRHYRTYVR